VLRIKPLRELRKLRRELQAWSDITVKAESDYALSDIEGDALELEISIAAPLPDEVGLHLLGDADGKDGMSIISGGKRKSLTVGTTQPPFELKEGEDLTLRVFVDKNLVEVFANDRQAAAFAHQHVRENPNIRLFASGGAASFKSIKAWKIETIYSGHGSKGEPPSGSTLDL
jgi:beta-fructofuranosidase